MIILKEGRGRGGGGGLLCQSNIKWEKKVKVTLTKILNCIWLDRNKYGGIQYIVYISEIFLQLSCVYSTTIFINSVYIIEFISRCQCFISGICVFIFAYFSSFLHFFSLEERVTTIPLILELQNCISKVEKSLKRWDREMYRLF